MILVKDERLINFTHIPRTAGRFVMSSLYQSGYRIPHSHKMFLNGREIIHATVDVEKAFYKHYLSKQLEELNNAPTFTIVRNPVDKFLSSSHEIKAICKLNNINPKKLELENYNRFVEMMEKSLFQCYYEDYNSNYLEIKLPYFVLGFRNIVSNWFEPQINFVDDKTKIWKYEDGLNDEFESWVIEEVGIKDFKLFQIDDSVKRNEEYDTDKLNSKYFTDKVKENIARYYKEDMIKFQYE